MAAQAGWSKAFKQTLTEHEELRLAVDRLRVAASAPDEVISRKRMQELLVQEVALLAEQLEGHFANEESGSFLGLEGHPELNDTLERLRREHQEFRERARELHEAVSRGEEAAGLRERVAGLLDGLDRHERQEHQMLQEALLRDSGVGD